MAAWAPDQIKERPASLRRARKIRAQQIENPWIFFTDQDLVQLMVDASLELDRRESPIQIRVA